MEGRVDRSWQIDLPGENEQVGEQIGGNEERRERKEHQLGEKDAPENRRIAELLEPEELPQKLRRARQEKKYNNGPAEPGSTHCQKTPCHARSSQIEVCTSYNTSHAGALALSLDKVSSMRTGVTDSRHS